MVVLLCDNVLSTVDDTVRVGARNGDENVHD